MNASSEDGTDGVYSSKIMIETEKRRFRDGYIAS